MKLLCRYFSAGNILSKNPEITRQIIVLCKVINKDPTDVKVVNTEDVDSKLGGKS